MYNLTGFSQAYQFQQFDFSHWLSFLDWTLRTSVKHLFSHGKVRKPTTFEAQSSYESYVDCLKDSGSKLNMDGKQAIASLFATEFTKWIGKAWPSLLEASSSELKIAQQFLSADDTKDGDFDSMKALRSKSVETISFSEHRQTEQMATGSDNPSSAY